MFKLVFLLWGLLLSPNLMAQWYSQQADIMGTRIHIELWSDLPKQAQLGVDTVMQEMRRIDLLMSPMKQQSQLWQVNQYAGTQAVKIGSEMTKLIKQADAISKLSDGAFDISFSSVGHLYNYRSHKQPKTKSKHAATELVDYRQIKLKDNSIQFMRSGMRIDLGGIAKGYAVDQSIVLLKGLGIKHAMVSAGGDSRLLGDKHGRDWLVGIRHPRKEQVAAIKLPLADIAVSTSGDYERFFISDGIRHHHIINPKTGDSARELMSVTIIGPKGVMTDALSTTVFVLGVSKGLSLIESLPDYSAIIIDAQFKTHYSSDLMEP